ncbi:MAG: GAP family protein [bacterium]|nr:GAP family protein [bacterium]
MSLSLIVALIGIAVADSLNPSLFVAQFYLLTTPKPTARILSYIAGILTVNYFGGVLLLGGARVLFADFIASLNHTTLYGVQLVVGLLILGFGLWMRAQAAETTEVKKPFSLRPIHTFALGMVVMVNELTTALPYFVAIERIAQADVGVVGGLALLLLYNAVFSLPLFGFLVFALVYRQHFAETLAKINRWMQVWMPRFIKYGSIAFGGVLSANAALMLTTGVGLFG